MITVYEAEYFGFWLHDKLVDLAFIVE